MPDDSQTTTWPPNSISKLARELHANDRVKDVQDADRNPARTILARRAEAGEMVALRAEDFLDRLDKRWPEVTDLDKWRDALLEAISELRTL